MQMMILTFAVTLIVIYFIRRMTIDHAWSIAIGVGAVLTDFIFVSGRFFFDISISIAGLLLGNVFCDFDGFFMEFIFLLWIIAGQNILSF